MASAICAGTNEFPNRLAAVGRAGLDAPRSDRCPRSASTIFAAFVRAVRPNIVPAFLPAAPVRRARRGRLIRPRPLLLPILLVIPFARRRLGYVLGRPNDPVQPTDGVDKI